MSGHRRAVQAEDVIALFELAKGADEVEILEQKHYQLVPAEDVTEDDLRRYQGMLELDPSRAG